MSHVDEGKLHAYLDGAASDRDRELIEGHLAECPECHARLDEAAALSARAASLLAELEPDAARAPAWRELEARAAARTRARPRGRWLRPSLAWAAVIVIAFGVGWFSNSMFLAQAPLADRAATSRQSSTGDDVAEVGSSVVEGFEEQGTARVKPQGEASEGSLEERQPAEILQTRSREVQAVDQMAPGRSDERVAAVTGAEAEVAANRRALTNVAETPPTEAPPGEPLDAFRLDVEAKRALQAAEAPAARAEAEADAAAGLNAPRAESPDAQVAKALESEPESFFAVSPEAAAQWLGGELRILPDLRLLRAEVIAGAAVKGGIAGLPAARLVYEDAAGHELVLTQQRRGDRSAAPPVDEPVMTVEPSGLRTYRWEDDRGYLLILTGSVSSDSLRALSARIR